jgi:hypothetical protein
MRIKKNTRTPTNPYQKINYKNLSLKIITLIDKKVKYIGFSICCLLLLKDFYTVAISPFFTGRTSTYTVYGILTSFLIFVCATALYENLD